MSAPLLLSAGASHLAHAEVVIEGDEKKSTRDLDDLRGPNDEPVATNTTTIETTGESGITAGDVVWSITNEGTVSSDNSGIYLDSTEPGATITNAEMGLIDAEYGIRSTGAAADVTNDGDIQVSRVGIEIQGDAADSSDNSQVENAGTITSTREGIYIENVGTASVTNSGTITSDNWSGVSVAGTVDAASIENTGTIESTGSGGIEAHANTQEIQNSGDIVSDLHGISVNVGQDADQEIQNSGTINADSSGSSIILGADSSASITNTGQISGQSSAIILSTGTGNDITMDNEGLLQGGTDYGVSPVVRNGTSLTLANQGRIESGSSGVLLDQRDNTSTTVENEGSISGDQTGLYIFSYNDIDTEARVVNSGDITGEQSTGGIGFLADGSVDVELVNSGTISGTSAIAFGEGDDRLVLEGDNWQLDGQVDGGNGLDTLVQRGGTLDDPSQFTGFELFEIQGGQLTVNQNATVDNLTLNGGRLGGTGTVNGGVVMEDGTLAPGNSIGTLTINGNYTHGPDAEYQVELNPAGDADRLHVTGTATLAGGTVAPEPQEGDYAPETTYTILTADGGVDGTFDSVADDYAFFAGQLSYPGNDVELTLQRSFVAGAETANQRQVGSAMDAAANSGNASLQDSLSSLVLTPAGEGPATLDQLHGEVHTAVASVGLRSGEAFGRALQQQLQAEQVAEDGWRSWARLSRDSDSLEGDGNSRDLDFQTNGVALGGDYRIDDATRVGAAFGFDGGNFELDGHDSDGELDSYHLAGYARHWRGGFQIDAVLGYSHHDYSLERGIRPGDIDRRAEADGSASQWQAGVEASYPLIFANDLAVSPFGGLRTGQFSHDSVRENGAGALGLQVDDQSTSSLRTTIGSRLDWDLGYQNLQLNAELAWVGELGDQEREVSAAFNGAPGQTFRTEGAERAGNAASIGLGLSADYGETMNFSLRYDGLVASDNQSHSVVGDFRLRW